MDLHLYNRVVTARCVLRSSSGALAALFTFAELCVDPLGPADFICIAEAFRTVFIAHVPVFTLAMRSEVILEYTLLLLYHYY